MKPYIAKQNEDTGVFKCKQIKPKMLPDWELIKEYFVDNSGFGTEVEPALTASQFLKHVKQGYGYAIIDCGQFQVYVGEFKKKATKRSIEQEKMNTL